MSYDSPTLTMSIKFGKCQVDMQTVIIVFIVTIYNIHGLR